MEQPVFSERFQLRPEPHLLGRDEVLPKVRSGLVWSLNQVISATTDGYTNTLKIRAVVARHIDSDVRVGLDYDDLENHLLNCEWWQFYNAVERACQAFLEVGKLSASWTDCARRFSSEINRLFPEYGVKYRLQEGTIEWQSEVFLTKKVEEARTLLASPSYHGPDTQFAKAIQFLNKRPEPDCENCVKDAVGALEAVARIIKGNNQATLSELLDSEPYRSNVHGALRETLRKIYAYRGGAPGVSHGLVGDSLVGIDEAELVLHQCASAIVYLVRKFGSQANVT